MDTHNLANGAYIVSVTQKDKSYQRRLVVAHWAIATG